MAWLAWLHHASAPWGVREEADKPKPALTPQNLAGCLPGGGCPSALRRRCRRCSLLHVRRPRCVRSSHRPLWPSPAPPCASPPVGNAYGGSRGHHMHGAAPPGLTVCRHPSRRCGGDTDSSAPVRGAPGNTAQPRVHRPDRRQGHVRRGCRGHVRGRARRHRR